MKIGNIKLKNNIFLAPMAGVTDLPFRLLCKEQGCDLVFTEMVSAKGLYYNDKKTRTLLETNVIEKPIGIQIFGSDANIMADVTDKYINDMPFDLIDINAGCPAPKIVKNGDGSSLLKTPEKLGEIITKVVKVSQKPVTLKIRTGWDEESINAIEIAQIAEMSGAVAITVHGRTREQFYTGQANWEIIKRVKEHVKIPVIGNGDIDSPQSAKEMIDYTRCDGIMIGRASMGNPWIFKRINHYIYKNELLPEPRPIEKIQKAIEHLEMLVKIKPERVAVPEMRKHVSWYTKGMIESAKLRNEINKVNTKNKMINLLNNYIENLL